MMIRRSFLCFYLVIQVFGLSKGQNLSRIEERAKLNTLQDNNGIAIADIDGDNDLDIYVVTRQKPNQTAGVDSKLFLNNGNGTFSDITSTSGITPSFVYTDPSIVFDFGLKIGASFGDYNNDGFPDLFLSNNLYLQLYRNNGDGTFTDVTTSAGIDGENDCYSMGGAWFDYNNDGFIDLYVSTWGESCRNIFYENDGDGTFTDKTLEMGLEGIYDFAFMALPLDINTDGWPDLYISNDFNDPNELYINQNGTGFVEAAADFEVTNIDRNGMGIAETDYNSDGLRDLFITNIAENSMYWNNGDGTFTDQSRDRNLFNTGWAWGVQFADIDHDKDEDIFVANGWLFAEPNRFSLNDGLGTFSSWEFDGLSDEETESNGLTVFDYDNDGDMDIILSNSDIGLHFYDNDLVDKAAPGEKNWIMFFLEGTISNRDALGSLLEIKVGSEVFEQYHQGANLYSQSLTPLHFGLDNSTMVDEVKITWPSGLVETYTDLASNRHFRLTENSGIQELNLVVTKILGCTDPNSCNFNPNATIDDGSCQYLTPGVLTGPETAEVNTLATYTYSGEQGSELEWTVTNGHIAEESESSIQVLWDIAVQGSVEVIENRECQTLPAQLSVTLEAMDMEIHTVARLWMDALLQAIRDDFARPTIHARNLFHSSVAMYDAWVVFDEGQPYVLGQIVSGVTTPFLGFETTMNNEEAKNTAISYAAYRVLSHRFMNSPGAVSSQERFNSLMDLLGYDRNHESTDYTDGNPATLGNYIAEAVIAMGLADGSRETGDFDNAYYQPVNPPMRIEFNEPTGIEHPNRWQPLQLRVFIDQAGNIVSDFAPEFLNPEWGNVTAFSLQESQVMNYERDGNPYRVFLDPGSPPLLDTLKLTQTSDNFKWNFAMVSTWSSHLDPADNVMWDISPAGIGGLSLEDFPTNFDDYPDFYEFLEGGTGSPGRVLNPITNQPYDAQVVPRGDYARVLAEFWADGPDSETPPGHWFTLLHYVNDQPGFEKKWEGMGEIIDPLEWDIKTHFTLGGAMHDAAIAAWSVKGWYDYIRPVSAIRYMAERGQSSSAMEPNYDPGGIPLEPGLIELVDTGDPLAGPNDENVGKVKLYAWKGPRYILEPDTDKAGVDWILAEDWWPYQRPSFVTPPFAGYVSGHSTYSRAAAEVLTLITGSEYFPNGMGEFLAKKNEFLVFEEGPSQDIVLQWATYRDAADQCSLSRIWGGIHPPADDIPGRFIGEQVGHQAYDLAVQYFNGTILSTEIPTNLTVVIYPNPARSGSRLIVSGFANPGEFDLFDISGRKVSRLPSQINPSSISLQLPPVKPGLYILRSGEFSQKILIR